MVKFQLSYLQAGTVYYKILYTSMNFERSNSFRLYLFKKNNNWWGVGLLERYLS